MTPEATLKKLARAAILRAKGNTVRAREEFEEKLLALDDASLERALCANYRSAAISALIATYYDDLKTEGKLPGEPRQAWMPAQRPEPARRPSDWMWDDEIGMTAKAHIRRYLDTFLVNGKPIGDCRVEEVDSSVASREADIRFMRELTHGLPPTVIIREHRTEEDAAKLWSETHHVAVQLAD